MVWRDGWHGPCVGGCNCEFDGLAAVRHEEAIHLRLVGVRRSIGNLHEPATWGNADDGNAATRAYANQTQMYRWLGGVWLVAGSGAWLVASLVTVRAPVPAISRIRGFEGLVARVSGYSSGIGI